jgi:hypothetical protein
VVEQRAEQKVLRRAEKRRVKEEAAAATVEEQRAEAEAEQKALRRAEKRRRKEEAVVSGTPAQTPSHSVEATATAVELQHLPSGTCTSAQVPPQAGPAETTPLQFQFSEEQLDMLCEVVKEVHAGNKVKPGLCELCNLIGECAVLR